MNYYRIADMNIATNYSGDAVIRNMQKYEICSTDKVDIDIKVNVKTSIDIPDVDIIREKYYRRYGYSKRGDYVLYDVLEDSGEVTSFIEISSDLTCANITCIDLEPIGGAPIDVRCFNMIGEVVRIVACHRGYVFLHSSAISYRGEAVLVSAPSGTGKSTHASMWVEHKGAIILNDDCPMILPVEDGFRVYGNPWSGKSFVHQNDYAMLKAVVFLTRSDTPSINVLPMDERRSKYLSQSYVYPFNATTLATLESVGNIYHNIPTYVLGANMSVDTLNIAFERIFNED
ncbi:MAG: hypothetical protein IKD20_03075 [Clostridia bacterium]|nr:hypothetical protein [Clostridia bacterium]